MSGFISDIKRVCSLAPSSSSINERFTYHMIGKRRVLCHLVHRRELKGRLKKSMKQLFIVFSIKKVGKIYSVNLVIITVSNWLEHALFNNVENTSRP